MMIVLSSLSSQRDITTTTHALDTPVLPNQGQVTGCSYIATQHRSEVVSGNGIGMYV